MLAISTLLGSRPERPNTTGEGADANTAGEGLAEESGRRESGDAADGCASRASGASASHRYEHGIDSVFLQSR